MGYRVLGRIEDIYGGYGPRAGLEGPFHFNERILYYDASEGKYWDPRTDFYLDHQEWESLMNSVVAKLAV